MLRLSDLIYTFLLRLIVAINFLSRLVQYEPELFPGLIYRMKQPKIVLLIFVSGKIVLTGAKVSFRVLLPHVAFVITFVSRAPQHSSAVRVKYS